MVAPNLNNRISPSGPIGNVKGSVAFEQEIADTAIAANSATFFNLAEPMAEVGDPAAVSVNDSLPAGLVISGPTVLDNTVGVSIANITGSPINTGDLVLSWLLFKLPL